MLHHELRRDEGILILTPEGPLEASDFERVAREIDPYIEDKGRLHGLMIRTESFPGWNDFNALVSHLSFVRNHHRVIEKVAAVTDNPLLSIAPRIAAHFVQAEVRHFRYQDKDAALDWLKKTD